MGSIKYNGFSMQPIQLIIHWCFIVIWYEPIILDGNKIVVWGILIAVWKIVSMVSIVDIACGITDFIKNRV